MLISTEIHSAAQLVGEERAVELCARAGFDAWDFSMVRNMCIYDRPTRSMLDSDHPLAGSNYLAYARQLKQIGLDNGIHCNQSHAPFPTVVPEVRAYLQRAIECTAEAGGKICVVHPGNSKSVEENAEMYMQLLPFAKECGVVLAAENMFNWDKEQDQALFAACSTPESFCAHLDAVRDESLVACLDIGHAEMMGDMTSAVEMILALGDRLRALHLHDNDRRHDRHQNLFTMQIDYAPIVQALRQVGYSGYLTLEANSYLKAFTQDTVLQGMQDLAAAAKRLRRMLLSKDEEYSE